MLPRLEGLFFSLLLLIVGGVLLDAARVPARSRIGAFVWRLYSREWATAVSPERSRSSASRAW